MPFGHGAGVRGPSISNLRSPGPGNGRDSTRLRLAILGVIVLSLFVTMLARLWYLQVLVAPELRVEAQANSVRLVYTEAPRGRILDRNGNVLVDNRIVPTVVVDRTVAAKNPELLENLSAYLGMPLPDLHRRLEDQRFSQYKPVPVAEDIPKEKVVYLREHEADFPGVDVVQVTQRTYPHETLAAHLLGYVGEINDGELERRRSTGYREGDTIGKSGAELAYEEALRGTAEVEKLQVDAHGHVLRSLGKQPAVPGHDVQLTIDLEVQRLAEESLRQGLEAANTSWDPDQLKRFIAPGGAVVVEDPRDGAILAMASYPTYHPKDFVNGITVKRFQELQDPAGYYPLTNRAIQGEYAPGSTFKPITALAALEKQIIAPETTINDTGSFRLGPQTFRNALGASHGPVDMARALTVSSDVYFYQLGAALDGKKKWGGFPIQEVAKSLGFAQPTAIELPFELEGRVPDADSRKRQHEENPEAFPYPDWYQGDTVNLSVGQGDLVVTPLQLANAYATLINGGTIWAPHVGGAVRDVLRDSSTPIETRQQGKAEMPPGSREAILAGLQQVVAAEEGTAAAAFAGFPLASFPIAGKTGTAEVFGKQDTALFVGAGPMFDPRYVVVAVMEESGFGASAAAPVVRRIFDGLVGNPPKAVARVGGRD
ncbi:MAG: penicillin-binding protein 2 [Actinomycetota bacterium]|nr:penicillin-binding protein 2 [Actinomycetota bacterium]